MSIFDSLNGMDDLFKILNPSGNDDTTKPVDKTPTSAFEGSNNQGFEVNAKGSAKDVANPNSGTISTVTKSIDTNGNLVEETVKQSKESQQAFINNQGMGGKAELYPGQSYTGGATQADYGQAMGDTDQFGNPVMGFDEQDMRNEMFADDLNVSDFAEPKLTARQKQDQARLAARKNKESVDLFEDLKAKGFNPIEPTLDPLGLPKTAEVTPQGHNSQVRKDLRNAQSDLNAATEGVNAGILPAEEIQKAEAKVLQAEAAFSLEVTPEVTPETTMAAAEAAGAIDIDKDGIKTIDGDWLAGYKRSVTPSDFDTTGIAEERLPTESGGKYLKNQKDKKQAQIDADKLAEKDPGTFTQIFDGITDWFGIDGNDEEGFWENIGSWTEENPVWTSAIASGVASYIETGSPYTAAGASVKGAVAGLGTKAKKKESDRTEDISLNKLYTSESVNAYRQSNNVTDLVGRAGGVDISGKPDQYKVSKGVTYGIWNKEGVSYTRKNGKFIPADQGVLTGRDVKSATAVNERWNGLGKSSISDITDQIQSQPAEYRIPVPAKSMANKVQKGVNALRRAFPGIDPNDPNIGDAVDQWFAANNARFSDNPKDFKWDTNVEKYMMNNIIMGKTTAENVNMADAFEIGGNGSNKHDVNTEETALAWKKMEAFVYSNKEDEYVSPQQGMKFGYDLYLDAWKPGTPNEHASVARARKDGIPPFIYFMNTVDLK